MFDGSNIPISDKGKEKDLTAIHLQFCPWLMAQISSGMFPGLEWIDDKHKKLFKIPWTKVNYPMWEEHHQIFKAWAVHRGKTMKDTGEPEQSFSQIKSNFRTILRKCVDIEEVEGAHQLGLQMGNYKVYRILSNKESNEKRKLQQEIRRAYKCGRIEDVRQVTGNGSNPAGRGKVGRPSLKQAKLKAEKATNTAKESTMMTADVFTSTNTVAIPKVITTQKKSNTKTQSTQTSKEDFPASDVTFTLEPAAFEEAVGNEDEAVMATDDISCNLHNSVSTQFQSEVKVEPMEVDAEFATSDKQYVSTETTMDIYHANDTSTFLDGFQMLLQAAQLAEAPAHPCMTTTQPFMSLKTEMTTTKPFVSLKAEMAASKLIPPSIVDVLVELKVPPEELFTYEMHVRYETRNVMSDVVLNDMSYGYRIHYGNHKDQRNLIHYHEPEKLDLIADFDRTPITLPESKVPPGNSLYSVLKNLNAGLIVKSDNSYTLRAKRLCMSRIYAFTKYGEVDADSEALLMPRDKEIVLFSYKKFLQDWHRFLIEGSPRPNHEINLAFGKKPKHRHSRVFVAVRLIPKAAETMLQRIGSVSNKHYPDNTAIQGSSLDNVLRLFNRSSL